MQETLSLRRNQDFGQVINSYIQLTKPRIILLLLFTTAAGLWISSKGQVDPLIGLVTILTGAATAGAANTINCLYDRDIDQIMVRTQSRPIPSGRVSPRDALIFAVTLITVSFVCQTYFVNLLSAALEMSGILCYVLVYTHWLKRHSTQNIVIGGAAGAIPPLVGWAAVTGELSWTAWVLFGIIFLWTPPHFWALAMMIREDYALVGVPMLPVVKGEAPTAKQIFIYTLALIPASLLLVYPLGVMGGLYAAGALGLGGLFVKKAWILLRDPSEYQKARSLFKYSIVYMLVLSLFMVVDSVPVIHSTINHYTLDYLNPQQITALWAQITHAVSLG